MSNAVDILLIDGPHSGVVLCQPKPVPATITHQGATYTTDTHNQVHVAFHDPDEIIADVDEMIAASGLTASWDLK